MLLHLHYVGEKECFYLFHCVFRNVLWVHQGLTLWRLIELMVVLARLDLQVSFIGVRRYGYLCKLKILTELFFLLCFGNYLAISRIAILVLKLRTVGIVYIFKN